MTLAQINRICDFFSFYFLGIQMTAIDRHPPNFPVHYPPIPQPLPEVPAPTGDAVKKAELEEVADAEIVDGAEIGRQNE